MLLLLMVMDMIIILEIILESGMYLDLRLNAVNLIGIRLMKE